MTITQQQVFQKWDNAPLQAREIMTSEEATKAVQEACVQEAVPEEKRKFVGQLTGFVILDLVPFDQFSKELQEKVGVNAEAAVRIAEVLNKKIFQPLNTQLTFPSVGASQVEMPTLESIRSPQQTTQDVPITSPFKTVAVPITQIPSFNEKIAPPNVTSSFPDLLFQREKTASEPQKSVDYNPTPTGQEDVIPTRLPAPESAADGGQARPPASQGVADGPLHPSFNEASGQEPVFISRELEPEPLKPTKNLTSTFRLSREDLFKNTDLPASLPVEATTELGSAPLIDLGQTNSAKIRKNESVKVESNSGSQTGSISGTLKPFTPTDVSPINPSPEPISFGSELPSPPSQNTNNSTFPVLSEPISLGQGASEQPSSLPTQSFTDERIAPSTDFQEKPPTIPDLPLNKSEEIKTSPNTPVGDVHSNDITGQEVQQQNKPGALSGLLGKWFKKRPIIGGQRVDFSAPAEQKPTTVSSEAKTGITNQIDSLPTPPRPPVSEPTGSSTETSQLGELPLPPPPPAP